MTISASRGWWIGGGTAVAVIGVVDWALFRPGHGDTDPGGRLRASMMIVEHAAPEHPQVLLMQAADPRWDSCDGLSGPCTFDGTTSP